MLSYLDRDHHSCSSGGGSLGSSLGSPAHGRFAGARVRQCVPSRSAWEWEGSAPADAASLSCVGG